jgi:hypothetical protein
MPRTNRVTIRAVILVWSLFLMLMDRYFFDLLRWTLGRVERTARVGGAELRDIDNNTQPVSLSEYCGLRNVPCAVDVGMYRARWT